MPSYLGRSDGSRAHYRVAISRNNQILSSPARLSTANRDNRWDSLKLIKSPDRWQIGAPQVAKAVGEKFGRVGIRWIFAFVEPFSFLFFVHQNLQISDHHAALPSPARVLPSSDRCSTARLKALIVYLEAGARLHAGIQLLDPNCTCLDQSFVEFTEAVCHGFLAGRILVKTIGFLTFQHNGDPHRLSTHLENWILRYCTMLGACNSPTLVLQNTIRRFCSPHIAQFSDI